LAAPCRTLTWLVVSPRATSRTSTLGRWTSGPSRQSVLHQAGHTSLRATRHSASRRRVWIAGPPHRHQLHRSQRSRSGTTIRGTGIRWPSRETGRWQPGPAQAQLALLPRASAKPPCSRPPLSWKACQLHSGWCVGHMAMEPTLMLACALRTPTQRAEAGSDGRRGRAGSIGRVAISIPTAAGTPQPALLSSVVTRTGSPGATWRTSPPSCIPVL
jgi:hypothetical protein